MSEFKKHARPVLLFSSFMLLQYVILRMGNAAGRGYISDGRQEYVYLFLQVFAISGFLTFAAARRASSRNADRLSFFALAVCFAGFSFLFFAPADSAVYLVLTAITVFCLGYIGGNVYLRMSVYTARGLRTGLVMGLGSGAAILIQYFFQLRRTLKVPLGIFALLAFAILLFLFREGPGKPAESENGGGRMTARRLAALAVIAAAMLLFTGYYNSYIHHLQVLSGYTEYNVYSWPRLFMIPALLLFGAVGDLKGGRFLPLAALCVSVTALLNSVLAGQSGANTLNMSLYYIALSAAIAYYDMTFWRAAHSTGRPALFASLGRILDSLCVLFSFAISLLSPSAPVVLSLNVAALVTVIVTMALTGGFDLFSSFAPREERSPEPVAGLSPSERTASDADPFGTLRDLYALTPGEIRVLRELVTTEDKQTAIAERLGIKVRTVQANVTSLYNKTGVFTRTGLVRLYNEAKERPEPQSGDKGT